MGVTKNYNRAKDPEVNVTGIDLTVQGREQPDALGNLAAGTGTTGIVDLVFRADADESGGADVQDLFRLDNVQVVLQGDGRMRLTGSIVPVLGDGTDGTPVPISTDHPENMDAWQTAAGRPRQP